MSDKKYKIYNADFRDVLPNIIRDNPERKIIIVSDPPFNVGYHYGTYKDRVSANDYRELMFAAFGELPCVVIHYPEELYRISAYIGKFPERVVSWVYNSNTAKQHRDIAFFGVKPDFNAVRQPYKNLSDKRIQKRIAEGKTGAKIYDWWNINQVKNVSKDKTGHPCQMPVEVMKNIVGVLPNDALIVDTFCGSGTTGVACKLLGRDFIGIDIDGYYCEISRNRIEQTQQICIGGVACG